MAWIEMICMLAVIFLYKKGGNLFYPQFSCCKMEKKTKPKKLIKTGFQKNMSQPR